MYMLFTQNEEMGPSCFFSVLTEIKQDRFWSLSMTFRQEGSGVVHLKGSSISQLSLTYQFPDLLDLLSRILQQFGFFNLNSSEGHKIRRG